MKTIHKMLFGGSVAVVTFVAGLGGTASCTSASGTGGGADLSDVVYVSPATDEGLENMLQATVVTDASQAAAFTWPTTGTVVDFSVPQTFCWIVGGGTAARDESPAERAEHPRAAVLERSFADRAAGSLAGLLLAGVPEAYAHGTPISGPAFFVTFSTSKNPKLLRVFTTALDYVTDAAAIAKLKTAGEPITAVVLHGEFDTNRIATGGGPFAGVPTTFTVAM